MQKKFRKLQQTGSGRATLRLRTPVEHALAHIAVRKGQRARYDLADLTTEPPRAPSALRAVVEQLDQAIGQLLADAA